MFVCNEHSLLFFIDIHQMVGIGELRNNHLEVLALLDKGPVVIKVGAKSGAEFYADI